MSYYLGFLKQNTKDVVIFKSLKTPNRRDFSYFVRVMGPYKSEDGARAGLHNLKVAYGEFGYRENPSSNPESRAKYCRERQMSPSAFAAGSFRTIRLGKKKKGVIACPKGHYHAGVCGVGTRLTSILHPVGSKGCPKGGLELAKRKRNSPKYLSDSQALALTRKVVALGRRLMRHERSELRQNNPAQGHIHKFLSHLSQLEKYAIGSKAYIDKLAEAYGHLKKAKEIMKR
jgi:hypothetical protein